MSIPALLLSSIHAVLIGSHFLGALRLTWGNKLAALLLLFLTLTVFLVRSPFFWSILNLEKFYISPKTGER
jgi:DMSO/TMAO reductase YedYZ heme-binding membrane subunit